MGQSCLISGSLLFSAPGELMRKMHNNAESYAPLSVQMKVAQIVL